MPKRECNDSDDPDEEENTTPTPADKQSTSLDMSPSLAGLPSAKATVACDPAAASSPNPRVAGVKKLCKLERQGSLEVLAVAASLVANPALG